MQNWNFSDQRVNGELGRSGRNATITKEATIETGVENAYLESRATAKIFKRGHAQVFVTFNRTCNHDHIDIIFV